MPVSKDFLNAVDFQFAELMTGSACDCLADFFRQEILKHQQCLWRQREYFSETAIRQAEMALMRTLEQVDCLCQRDDAGRIVGELLRKFDAVTNLSAWTDLQLH
jgi:hypothetical protein